MSKPTSQPPAVRAQLQDLLSLAGELRGISLQPRRSRAALGGDYQTRFRGRGMEFSEVRGYQPGDDVRNIDWRVTARRGKPHTKLFHEERERPLLIALDLRRPMFFGTRSCFKAVQAARIAALLGWCALQQGDRVGAFLFSEEQHRELRPQRGKGAVLTMLRAICSDPAWDRPPHLPFEPRQRLYHTLVRLRRVARPGSLVLLVSDFAQWDEEVEKQLALLGRHADLALFHCYDPLERTLPPAGTYRLTDGGTDLTMSTLGEPVRRGYQERFAGRLGRITRFCRQQGAMLVSCGTDQSAAAVLRSGLEATRRG